jgi:hypothetical protein
MALSHSPAVQDHQNDTRRDTDRCLAFHRGGMARRISRHRDHRSGRIAHDANHTGDTNHLTHGEIDGFWSRRHGPPFGNKRDCGVSKVQARSESQLKPSRRRTRMTVCGHQRCPVGVAKPRAFSSSAALYADKRAVRMNTGRISSARAIAAALFACAPAMPISLLRHLAAAESPFVPLSIRAAAARQSAATERTRSFPFRTCRSIAYMGYLRRSTFRFCKRGDAIDGETVSGFVGWQS